MSDAPKELTLYWSEEGDCLNHSDLCKDDPEYIEVEYVRADETRTKAHAGTAGHVHVGDMLERLLAVLPMDSGFLISTNRPDCGWLIERLATKENITIYENGTWDYAPRRTR